MERLPLDVFIGILSYLSVKDLLTNISVCKWWNIYSQHNYLWKNEFEKEFCNLNIFDIKDYWPDPTALNDLNYYKKYLKSWNDRVQKRTEIEDKNAKFIVYGKPNNKKEWVTHIDANTTTASNINSRYKSMLKNKGSLPTKRLEKESRKLKQRGEEIWHYMLNITRFLSRDELDKLRELQERNVKVITFEDLVTETKFKKTKLTDLNIERNIVHQKP